MFPQLGNSATDGALILNLESRPQKRIGNRSRQPSDDDRQKHRQTRRRNPKECSPPDDARAENSGKNSKHRNGARSSGVNTREGCKKQRRLVRKCSNLRSPRIGSGRCNSTEIRDVQSLLVCKEPDQRHDAGCTAVGKNLPSVASRRFLEVRSSLRPALCSDF